MRYIRTIKHIYKRLFIDRAIINECGYGTCDKDLNPIGETIVKESDNLEELCDEFVAVGRLTEQPFIVRYPKAYYKNMNVFGAIWTDKGLIYVAKMNDKGELELLWVKKVNAVKQLKLLRTS